MDDSSQNGDKTTPKYSAPKDKSCPFCGQAFTSSSLGRHLDLYVRDKNPKPPDGIHNVDEIKKLRGSITRRQPRASLGGRREVSTPTGTPRGSTRTDSVAREASSSSSSAIPKEGQYAVDSTIGKYPFPAPRWESTGVINDICEASSETGRRPGLSRTTSRQIVQKAQFDAKHKLSDAMDTARAAELALRELLSSWRAAKQVFPPLTLSRTSSARMWLTGLQKAIRCRFYAVRLRSLVTRLPSPRSTVPQTTTDAILVHTASYINILVHPAPRPTRIQGTTSTFQGAVSDLEDCLHHGYDPRRR